MSMPFTLEELEIVVVVEDPIKVAVLGTGSFGVAFADRASRCGRGVEVVMGSRRGAANPDGFPMPCPVVSYEKAASWASIIVIAVPVYAFAKVIRRLEYLLEGKIIVDVSSSTVPGTWERTRTPFSAPQKDSEMSKAKRHLKRIEVYAARGLNIVKAFDNISSHTLYLGAGSYGANGKQCLILGGDERAKQAVAALARKMGFRVKRYCSA